MAAPSATSPTALAMASLATMGECPTPCLTQVTLRDLSLARFPVVLAPSAPSFPAMTPMVFLLLDLLVILPLPVVVPTAPILAASPPMDLLAVLPLPVAAPAAPIPTAPAAFPVTFPALALQTMAPMVFLLLDPLAVPFLLVAAPTVAAPTVPIPAASPPTDLLAVLEIFLNLFPGALQATALAMLQVASQVLDL